MLSVVADETARAVLRGDLDELAREGARRMLVAALEAEVDDYLAAHAAGRDERGRRLVVRNGHARQRQVTTVAGSIPVRTPRVDDRRTDPATGGRARFRSVILPPWCRKSPRWPRSCRCCTCTGCPPATSCRPWRGSSALPRGCRGRGGRSAADRLAGRLPGVLRPRPSRPGLCVRVGRRGPLPGAT